MKKLPLCYLVYVPEMYGVCFRCSFAVAGHTSVQGLRQ